MSHTPTLLSHKFHDCGGGKLLRYAIVEPEQACGTVVIAPGRREFIEKKYAEIGQEFLRRGFRLILFEWRGQGLSDRILHGPKRQRDHATDFVTHLDDLSSLYGAVIQSHRTGPLFLCGHSMGSHLLLRWIVERQPKDIAGLITTAPMLALAVSNAVARGITWVSMHLGHGSDYAPAQHDYDPSDRSFTKNPLTHDAERFAMMEHYFAAFPELTVGGVTWGWLDAALRSMHLTQHPAYFNSLKTPVLAITGGSDIVTPARELTPILARARSAQHIVIPGSLHDVMNEVDAYRMTAWRYIDAFTTNIMNA